LLRKAATANSDTQPNRGESRSPDTPRTISLPERLTAFSGKPVSRTNPMHTKYLIVIEKTPDNLSAFSPDLPGCVATGATQAEVEERMREAIRMHIDGMREDGEPIPVPSCVAEYVET